MTTFPAAVTDAIAYVSAQDVEVPPDVWVLAVQAGALKATGDLAAINAQYHDAVTESLITYLEGGSLAKSKNSFKRAMIEAFGGAWDAGWDGNPPTGEALEWLNARTQQELAFIDGLYVQAKELRKDPEADTFAWATARADGYTGTVDNIYNHARIRALGNKMLTFDGEDGSPDNICQSTNGTCVRLKGKRHRASWWIAHDLVPYRGNPNYDCGAWECRHYLKDDKGERYTFGGGSQAVKHEGPGNHPGTGSPQEVHAGDGGSSDEGWGDEHARANVSVVPGKRKMPWQMTREEYESLAVVYRGTREGSATEGYAFFSNDPEIAKWHGKVREYRVLAGARIYPDPEVEGEMDKTLSGLESLQNGSAVINYDDVISNYRYDMWKHKND